MALERLFSTDDVHPRDGFRRYREIVCDQLMFCELESYEGRSFAAKMECATIGPLGITAVAHGAMRLEVTQDALRRQRGGDSLYVALKRSGRAVTRQGEREAITGAGDIFVLDQQPMVDVNRSAASVLVLEIPRDRLESLLGPARLYTALTVGADRASTQLATTFFRDLIQVREDLPPDSAARMASIGVDLIVASLAERMAQEVPRTLHGTVVVQRAKAYIEANRHDADLDPPALAAAMGVSLRRLQELFHERGQHISDWIWERRLALAAERLADPACLHLPIGTLAYACGFVTPAHFTRRFKHHHGLAPGEFRRAAIRVAGDDAAGAAPESRAIGSGRGRSF